MTTKLYRYSFSTSLKKWPKREGLILEHNGGWGEIAPLPSLSQETLEEATEEILSLLSDIPNAKSHLPSVQFGLHSARIPLVQEIRVPIGSFNQWIPGTRSMKLKVEGLSIPEVIELVKKYKPMTRLRIDANRSWTLEEALFFAEHFAPDDFEYLEEPVENFEDLIQFSTLSQFPIALDESVHLKRHREIPTLKAVVIKPMLHGPIFCFDSIPVVLSSTYETDLGHLLIARMAQKNTLPLGLGTFDCVQPCLVNPNLSIQNGLLKWSSSNFKILTDKLCLIATAP